MQEKESIMVVWCGYKTPRDAKQCPSHRCFYPHLTPMKDSFMLTLSYDLTSVSDSERFELFEVKRQVIDFKTNIVYKS